MKRTMVWCGLVMVGAVGIAAGQVVPQPKMGAPLAGLDAAQLQRFDAGLASFRDQFTVAEGLGPIFNQSSCASCHNRPIGGAGSIDVTRFGNFDAKGIGFDPLGSLGGSLLQSQSIAMGCEETIPAGANVIAQRITPSILGAGLVEALDDAAIAARELSPPSPNVSGRAHLVQPLEDPVGPQRVGRFGWKAQVATVLTFSGDASLNEMGMTNRLVPTENAPNGNATLLGLCDAVADPEDGPDGQGFHFIDRITDFQRFLAAPPQTPRSGMSGEMIFNTVGCADCHVAAHTTRNDPTIEAAIRNRTIRPYSDFLLHDMGVAADFIADGSADGQEIRTPSLWGLRTRDPIWHDGRVGGGTLETRMLSTGGVIDLHAAFGSESVASALAFQALSATDRLKVVAFLDSLGRAEFDGNGDDEIDRLDLAGFLAAQGGGPYTADDAEAVYDVDQNGLVDQVDFNVLVQVYEEDCNQNGFNDLMDVLAGTSTDVNGNFIPDECETCQSNLGFGGGGTLAISICGDPLTAANSSASGVLTGGPANSPVFVAISFSANPTAISGLETLVPAWPLAALLDGFQTDSNGELRLVLSGQGGPLVMNVVLQAATFDGVTLDLSNALLIALGS